MNITAFTVHDTNIFPISNSHSGGQLLSEFNIRSRESVGTDPNVTYHIGPSYTHSMNDFAVTLAVDGSNTVISSSSIILTEGRALVNGHYIESLVPITIDLSILNASLQQEDLPILKGKLCIGLRAMYSTESTMSGAMLTESVDGVYQGIQIVILPKDGAVGEKFTLPSDSPDDEMSVTAHLKLAEFTFENGTVTNIIQNEDKISVVSAERISSVTNFISDIYVKKTGLDPWKLYTYSGRSSDTEYDSWCDSMDSLMIWDDDPHPVQGVPNGINSAAFLYDYSNDKVVLQIPHKQPDGGIYGSNDEQWHYEDKILNLPSANYGSGTGGVVTKSYTNSIHEIDRKIQNFYNLPNGKMRYYYDGVLTEKAKADTFPKLYENIAWVPGDYVLVSQDATVSDTLPNIIDTDSTVDTTSVYGRYPSTMYVILPPRVAANGISYVESTTNPNEVPSSLVDGTLIGRYTFTGTSYDYNNIPYVSGLLGIESGNYRGTVNKDYFVVTWENTTNNVTTINYYFYKVTANNGFMEFASDPIFVTGAIPFAQENMVGGFLNVPSDALGGGYIYRDEYGHLRLADYQYLASGVLAYQLGQDYRISGTITEIQNFLDQYVNDRVAFPNSTQLMNYRKYNRDNGTNESPKNIHIYIDIPETDVSEGQVELTIYDIDSRFSTPVYIHLEGNGTSNTIVNILNCEKVRILVGSGTPTIQLYNSCLYYDADIIDRLTTIQGLSLWYEKTETSDPNIQVNGMTVELVGSPSANSNDEDYWNISTPNDNHYRYALRSITFCPDGIINGLSMYVTDDITGNNAEGTYIFASNFALPQGSSLQYPPSSITKSLKVTGTFVTAYPISQSQLIGYVTKTTTFTAFTNPYSTNSGDNYVSGTISFLTKVENVRNVNGDIPANQVIDGWATGQYHIFNGGAVD